MSHHRLVTESIQSMVTHKQNSHFKMVAKCLICDLASY